MNIQYQFQITITSITLKTTLSDKGLFRITLIQTSKEIEPSSELFQTEQKELPPNQKTVALTSLKPFKFRASKQHPPGTYILKFEIKGSPEGSPLTIPLPISKMLSEFKSKNKSIGEYSFEAKNSTIHYKVQIFSCDELGVGEAVTLQLGKVNCDEEKNSKSKFSQSSQQNGSKGEKGRKSRPPQLKVSKKVEEKVRAISLEPKMSSKDSNTPAFSPRLDSKESMDELQSPQTLRKKVSSLPLSEIEKVNELIATHHRIEEPHSEKKSMSYKLKIVFFMVILGVFFLLYDTIGDRSKRREEIRNIQKKNQKEEEKKGRKKLAH